MKRSVGLTICAMGCGLFLSCAALPVFAQNNDTDAAKQHCSPPAYEAISTLYTPSFGTPVIWDAVYENGRDGNVRLVDALPMADGTVLVIGDAYGVDEVAPTDFVFARINRRGRTVMERRHALKPQEETVAMIPFGEGYIVASHFGPESRTKLRLSWYGQDGAFVKEKVITSPEDDYKAEGILPTVDGKGFLVYAKAVSGGLPGHEYSRIFSFAGDGGFLWERSYRPGIPNMTGYIFSVKDTGHYMASGSIRMDDGRMGGWLLELDEEGAIVWQRTYPRGLSAVLDNGLALPDGRFVMAGVSAPTGGGTEAAWIMEISKTGEPVWQHFLRHGDLSLSAIGLDRRDDGRMVLMLNAKAESEMIGEQEGRDHIRLLTLSPRGEIMQDEPYVDAVHAKGKTLMTGWKGERIMLANTTEREASEEEKEAIERSLGWVVVAPPLDPYKDICEDMAGQNE